MSKPSPEIIQPATIRWRDHGQPVSTVFDDVYFNSDGGIDESRYVFLEQNGLPERWANNPGGSFTIGETGFGTGLNFLVAAQAWLDKTSTGTLHFVSVEKFPLTTKDLQQSLKLWPVLKTLADELVQLYPPATPGIHRLQLANKRITLTLMYGEANPMFASLKCSDHPLFHQQGNPVIDAWFLDGFTPVKNPAMWTNELFQTIADLSGPDTTISTFTSACRVQRGLQNAGFDIEKIPGINRKREMLRGTFTNSEANTSKASESDWTPSTFNSHHQPPWYLNPITKKPESAIVLGGGIAGCATARSLAERGIPVTLIERHPQLGQEGSGNPQGILYPKLSTGTSVLARFGLTALLHASRYHSAFLDSNATGTEAAIGSRCGVLVLPASEKDKDKFEQLAELFPTDLVQLHEGEQLNQTAGMSLANHFGLFFPTLGWIKPPVACQMLTEHPLITVQTADVADIELQQNGWHARDEAGNTIAAAQVMVIAGGFDSSQFSQTNHLFVKKIRGQISQLPATPQSTELKTVLCGEGYIAPAIGGIHTLGATYNFGETSTAVRTKDHQINLQQLATTDAAVAETFDPVDIDNLQGRAAFRCTTPDYLPIAGPAPKLDDYLNDYALLRKNARAHIPIAGNSWPGLYLNMGHGSRGLSYAPICAELLASQICGEVPPLELDLRQAVHPGRFIIRDLIRKKR